MQSISTITKEFQSSHQVPSSLHCSKTCSLLCLLFFVLAFSATGATDTPSMTVCQENFGPLEVPADLGSHIELECCVITKNVPSPIFRWKNPVDDSDLTKLPRYKASKDQRVLRISNVSSSDSGGIRCNVFSGFGQVNIDYIVNVRTPEKPLWNDASTSSDNSKLYVRIINPISDFSNQTKKLGSSLALTCSVESSHKPAVRWLRPVPQGFRVSPSNHIVFQNLTYWLLYNSSATLQYRGGNRYTSQLMINNLQPENEDWYFCYAQIYSQLSTLRGLYLKVDTGQVNANPLDDSSFTSHGNPYLAVFIGIPVCLSVVLLMLVVFICQKRQANLSAIKKREPVHYETVHPHETLSPLYPNVHYRQGPMCTGSVLLVPPSTLPTNQVCAITHTNSNWNGVCPTYLHNMAPQSRYPSSTPSTQGYLGPTTSVHSA